MRFRVTSYVMANNIWSNRLFASLFIFTIIYRCCPPNAEQELQNQVDFLRSAHPSGLLTLDPSQQESIDTKLPFAEEDCKSPEQVFILIQLDYATDRLNAFFTNYLLPTAFILF